MTRSLSTVCLLTITAIALGVSLASADAATVTNHSFEDTTGMADFAGFKINDPPGWTGSDMSGFYGSATAGQLNGINGAHLDRVAWIDASGTLTSDVIDTTTIGSTYTLTVGLGNRDDTTRSPQQYTIQLLVDGVAQATEIISGGDLPTNDQIEDYQASFVAAAAGDLRVRLIHTQLVGTGTDSQGVFDNVRVEEAAATVPTPAALPVGLLALAMIATRRR